MLICKVLKLKIFPGRTVFLALLQLRVKELKILIFGVIWIIVFDLLQLTAINFNDNKNIYLKAFLDRTFYPLFKHKNNNHQTEKITQV